MMREFLVTVALPQDGCWLMNHISSESHHFHDKSHTQVKHVFISLKLYSSPGECVFHQRNTHLQWIYQSQDMSSLWMSHFTPYPLNLFYIYIIRQQSPSKNLHFYSIIFASS